MTPPERDGAHFGWLSLIDERPEELPEAAPHAIKAVVLDGAIEEIHEDATDGGVTCFAAVVMGVAVMNPKLASTFGGTSGSLRERTS